MPHTDPLIALRASLAERLAALRGVPATRLPPDVLYAPKLFPRLVKPGGELRIADPNRAGAERFPAGFDVESERGEDVSFHTLRFDARAGGHT